MLRIDAPARGGRQGPARFHFLHGSTSLLPTPHSSDSEWGSAADEPLLGGFRADWDSSKGLQSALIVHRPIGWGGKGAHTRSEDCIRAGTRRIATGSSHRFKYTFALATTGHMERLMAARTNATLANLVELC